MKEASLLKILSDSVKVAEGFTGSRISLKWREQSTGEWDSFRKEYVGGGPVWIIKDNVPCLIRALTAGDVKYGRWGHCEVGDLVVCIDKSEKVTGLQDLRVILNKQEYVVIPNTYIPYSSISGFVGAGGPFRALHCRLLGKQRGVAQ